jgi:hypothetical protein
MAKRVFKKDSVKEAVKNIANDFRYSNDVSEYALLFYKADKDSEVRGEDIDKMIEYVEIGLKELEAEFQNLQWRSEFMSDNPSADEIQIISNLQTIESEYKTLLEFLKK